MKVIQITDEDAKQLLDDLELAKWRGVQFVNTDVPEAFKKQVEAWAHRHFHYVVATWLQKHGAKIT